jgi:hypothetical protein
MSIARGASARSGFRAAKGAWTVLGNPSLHETRAATEASIVAAADANAKRFAPILREVEAAGAMSLLQIAAALAARGIPAVTGAGRWSPQAACEPETSLALACSHRGMLSKSASTRPVMGELASRMADGGRAILSTHVREGAESKKWAAWKSLLHIAVVGEVDGLNRVVSDDGDLRPA